MLRNRFLILLAGCFLASSAAWADEAGYIDCRNHPDETQVFAKPRNSRETVASLPCGQRFTILLYGFIFSRVQTSDGDARLFHWPGKETVALEEQRQVNNLHGSECGQPGSRRCCLRFP